MKQQELEITTQEGLIKELKKFISIESTALAT
jgi:hypothetical protein